MHQRKFDLLPASALALVWSRNATPPGFYCLWTNGRKYIFFLERENTFKTRKNKNRCAPTRIHTRDVNSTPTAIKKTKNTNLSHIWRKDRATYNEIEWLIANATALGYPVGTESVFCYVWHLLAKLCHFCGWGATLWYANTYLSPSNLILGYLRYDT